MENERPLMTDEEAIAAFKTLFPHCYQAMEDMLTLTNKPRSNLFLLVAHTVRTFSRERLNGIERAFTLVGPDCARELMLQVHDAMYPGARQ
jgi:hypothetical protein